MGHDGVANGSDAFEEVESVRIGGARKRLDEDDAGGRLRAGSVETLDTKWHRGEKVGNLRTGSELETWAVVELRRRRGGVFFDVWQ